MHHGSLMEWIPLTKRQRSRVEAKMFVQYHIAPKRRRELTFVRKRREFVHRVHGGLLVPRGLVPAALLAAGISLEQAANASLIAPLGPLAVDPAGFVTNNFEGLSIRHSSATVAWHIAFVAQRILVENLCDERIGIVCATRAKASKLGKQLRKQLGSHVVASPGWRSRFRPKPITVGTLAQLGSPAAAFGAIDLLFFADAAFALQRDPTRMLLRPNLKVFGFLSARQRLALLEDDRLNKVFEFARFHAWENGFTLRHVTADFLQLNGRIGIGHSSATGPDRLRALVWTNQQRHSVLRSLISGLFHQDAAQLRSLRLPGLSDYIAQQADCSIAVIVENAEHWRSLDLESRFAARGVVSPGNFANRPASLRRTRLVGLTASQLRADSRLEYDVIVRADGGSGGLEIRPGQLKVGVADNRPLFIVDVMDQFHPAGRQSSESRRRSYEANGSFASNLHPIEAAAGHFLRRAPRGNPR